MASRGNRDEVGQPAISNKQIEGSDLKDVVPLRVTEARFDVTGSYIQRAREHLRGVEGFGGLPAEFESDPRVATTSGGAVTVHMRQHFKSIPVFLAAQTVRFKPDGTVDNSIGFTLTFSEDLSPEPRLSSPQAVLAAAKHVTQLGQGLLGEPDDFGNPLDPPRLDLTGFQPTVVGAFPDIPERPTLLAPGPFGHPIKASLTWYPAAQKPVLGWEVILTMPQGAGQYRVIVDANSGAILYSRQLVDLLIARGNVFLVDGSARTMTSFPRPWSDYAIGFDAGTLPPGVPPEPSHWVDDTRRDTVGNCVNAHLGDSGPSLMGRTAPEGLTFDPSPGDGDDQKVLNIFYYNSYLHDVFYLLGFREEDGNFQEKGIGGVAGDPVDARAHSGAVWGTANMFTPPDGTSPTMNMGLVLSTNRHTAFDATVVFHEYMHGVTNRLVGGPMNTHALEEPQSKAMGEGWGDYIACTLTNTNVVGSWVTNQPAGIRSKPYDSQYPGTYGQLGQGIYVAPHKVGEIWCSALMETNRNLNARLGTPRGQRLAFQLVVDALKLSPTNPSMLDMRDAIFSALDHKRQASPGLSDTDYNATKAGIWAAFAKFGMGVRAKSVGAKFADVVEDFTPGTTVSGPGTGPSTPGGTSAPPTPVVGGVLRLEDKQQTAIPDNQLAGVSRVLSVNAAGQIKRVTVHVNIVHPYVGDLLVRLAPPGRPQITLHNQAYQDAPDLVVDYTSADKLAPLIGQQAQGDWTLIVADTFPDATGAIRGWGLEIELAGASGPSGLMGEAFAAGAVTEANRLLDELNRLVARLAQIAGSAGPR